MKNILLSLLLLCSSFVFSQETFYKANSNLVVADTINGHFNIGLNYEFSTKKIQLIYNFSPRYFVFGSYNFDNSNETQKSLFGDERTIEKQNSGYSFGAGLQKLGAVGIFKNLELLCGYEFQKVNNYEYYTNNIKLGKDHLNQEYFTVFTQFNMMRVMPRYDFGFSWKLTYLKFSKIEYNDLNGVFAGKHVFLILPTVNYNYKLLPKKKLLLTSQFGISAALMSLESETGNKNYSMTTSEYIAGSLLKIGIQYIF